MGRLEINRAGEMDVFVRVVDAGGFTPAARLSRMTPSAVSKLVSRLERRLGTRLFNRSTRQLQLTPEGAAFYDRSVRILADLAEAEQCASASALPHGRVRINVNVPMGRRFLLPLVPALSARYPDLVLDIVLTDTVVDLMEDRTDIAIRHGPLKSSRLMARKLGRTRMRLVAAPAYLARYGMPGTPADLRRHRRIGSSYWRMHDGWPQLDDGGPVPVLPPGIVQASDGDAVLQLAIAGMGLALQLRFCPEAREVCCGLMSTSKERPSEDMLDGGAASGNFHGEAADFLD
ncbi:LysR family transcriptional regulator [Gluconacetobacter diazotrophicus]|uniref:LysR family transcriptional regulator n=2 Tax=Gluconacetobacter diazotrophicus TaxID=33996 RepID=UPI000173C179|nr:LysR family transcriptional regulator [Gluconacetobacter diazotrophicus]